LCQRKSLHEVKRFLITGNFAPKTLRTQCLSEEIGETQTLKFCSTFAGARRCVTCVLKTPSKAALTVREEGDAA